MMQRLKLEGVRILFKNFRGEKSQFNSDGARQFSVVIDDIEEAERYIDLGWALKPLKNEEGDISAYHLPVKINYSGFSLPRIYKVSMPSGNQLLLEESTISMLDYLLIDYVDIIVNPYEWAVRGERGVKAYCQTMYVVIADNDLDTKWSHLDDASPFEE